MEKDADVQGDSRASDEMEVEVGWVVLAVGSIGFSR